MSFSLECFHISSLRLKKSTACSRRWQKKKRHAHKEPVCAWWWRRRRLSPTKNTETAIGARTKVMLNVILNCIFICTNIMHPHNAPGFTVKLFMPICRVLAATSRPRLRPWANANANATVCAIFTYYYEILLIPKISFKYMLTFVKRVVPCSDSFIK